MKEEDLDLGSTALFSQWLRAEIARENRKVQGCFDCCPHKQRFTVLEQCLSMLKICHSDVKFNHDDKYAISTTEAMDYVEGLIGKQDCYTDRVNIALYGEILRLRKILNKNNQSKNELSYE